MSAAERGRPLMCRWIAYRGETTAFEHYVTEPEHSLLTQSLRALQATTATNGDGFGLGWYGDHPEPGLYRETRPAWSDKPSGIYAVICPRIYSLPTSAQRRAPPLPAR